MKFTYNREGWYTCSADSGKSYYLRPRDAYCTCPSTKKPCKHLIELYKLLKNGGEQVIPF